MTSDPTTRLDIEFADGEYTFHLGLAQIAELQAKCGCGIGALYARVLRGRYLIDGEVIANPLEAQFFASDLVETVRQGLIGGAAGKVDGIAVALAPADANRLIGAYLYPQRPLAEAWALAAAILDTTIDGYTPADKKKGQVSQTRTAGSTTRKRSRTAQ